MYETKGILILCMFLLSIKVAHSLEGIGIDNPDIPHLNRELEPCFMGGVCVLTDLIVDNLEVIGSYVNITVEDYTVIGDMNVTGSVYIEGNVTADYFIGDGSLLTGINTSTKDIWVNETGDTMTGDLKVLADVNVSKLDVSGLGNYIFNVKTNSNIIGVLENTGAIGGTDLIYKEGGGGEWGFKAIAGNGGFKIRDRTAGEDRFKIENDGDVIVHDGDLIIESNDIMIDQTNGKLYLGEGQQASLYYNSNDMIINPREVDTGDLLISGDADLMPSDNNIYCDLGGSANRWGNLWLGHNLTTNGDIILDDDKAVFFGDDKDSRIYYSGATFFYDTNGDSHLFKNGNIIINNSDNGLVLRSGTSQTTRYGLKYGSAGNLGDSDDLALTNRETNGAVLIQADNGSGGSIGETTIARFEDDNVKINGDLNVTRNLTVGEGTIILDGINNRVGIGTLNPLEALDVVGNINASGNIQAGTFGQVSGETAIFTADGQFSSINIGVGGANRISVDSGFLDIPSAVQMGSYLYQLGYHTIEADSNNVFKIDGFGGFNNYVNVDNIGTQMFTIDSGMDLRIDSDNEKIILGEGQDSSIYYDGTHLNINPAEVGSGDLKVSTDLEVLGHDVVVGSSGSNVDNSLHFEGQGHAMYIDHSQANTELSFTGSYNNKFKFDGDLNVTGMSYLNNITMSSPNGSVFNCGVSNTGTWSCT